MTIDLLARTSAVLIAGSLIAALMRRAAPATRHLVWHLSIVIVLLAPAIIALGIKVPMVPTVPELPEVAFQKVPIVPAVPSVENNVEHETLGTNWNQTLGTLETIGTIGTFAVLGWFLFCWLLSGLSVWRGSTRAPENWNGEARVIGHRLGLKRSVTIRQSLKDGSPHVAGLFSSIVMMPPSASMWTAEARQAALVHELTHIKRRDRSSQAIAQLACAIYWFNPLVWHAAAGLARERERACDDEVLRFGAKPSAYATLLLDLARKPGSVWTPAAALSMARPSAIEGRLLSILADAVRVPRRSTRWLVGLGIITITTAILGAENGAASTPPSARPAPVKPQPLVRPQMLMALDDKDRSDAVTNTLVRSLSDTDRGVREHAAMGLALTPGSDVIDPLINALKDPDSQVREKAAIGLAFRRDPRIIDPLLAAIDDGDSQVREKAAIALGASGDARAIEALTKATTDPDSQVREKAVAGLLLLRLRR
jgi:beta-lactamase regulating signal transducer with metallopeptidase domain